MTLDIQPITFAEATAFVKRFEPRMAPPQGMKFAVAVNDGEKVVGIAIAGRPVARHLDDGYRLEVTRCVTDGSKGAKRLLYSATWKVANAMGYRSVIVYVTRSEKTGGLTGAGFKTIGESKGGSWNREGRPRVDKHPLQPKLRFERKRPSREEKAQAWQHGTARERRAV